MKKLPDCDDLFLRFIAPWYHPEDTKRRVYTATRPDAESLWKPGTPVKKLKSLAPEAEKAVAKQIAKMVKAAKDDWSRYLEIRGAPSLKWIAAFDRYYDRKAIRAVIGRSDPTDSSNDYLILSIEFAVVLGEVIRHRVPGAVWLYDWPYWESAIYHAPSGTRINVFHWAVKKLSEYGVDDGFAPKTQALPSLFESITAEKTS